MYILTARSRDTKRWIDLEYFNDSRQFYYELDTVDPDLYSEAMIIDENHHLMMYVELKETKNKVLTKSNNKSCTNKRIGDIK